MVSLLHCCSSLPTAASLVLEIIHNSPLFMTVSIIIIAVCGVVITFRNAEQQNVVQYSSKSSFVSSSKHLSFRVQIGKQGVAHMYLWTWCVTHVVVSESSSLIHPHRPTDCMSSRMGLHLLFMCNKGWIKGNKKEIDSTWKGRLYGCRSQCDDLKGFIIRFLAEQNNTCSLFILSMHNNPNQTLDS